MTESEKLFAGKIFDPRDPELAAVKRQADEIMARFNAVGRQAVGLHEQLLRELFDSVGAKPRVHGPLYVNYGKHIRVGNNFFANYNLTIQDDALVTIGDNCDFGPNVSIVTPLHPMLAEERLGFEFDGVHYGRPCIAKPIIIGNGVWIGAGATICAGVTIGDGAVIGAGSVVTRDVPARCFAAGVPCKVVRQLSEQDSWMHRPELF